MLGFPITRTIDFPLKSSQTSLEVDDMSSSSANARFSLARPMKDLAILEPWTRMAPVIMVKMPRGTIARMR